MLEKGGNALWGYVLYVFEKETKDENVKVPFVARYNNINRDTRTDFDV